MRQTSCYCFPWRGLHRRGNAGIVWVGQPGDYATFNSYQPRYATQMEQTADYGLVVTIVYQNRPERPDRLTIKLDAEIAQRRELLTAREREVLENHLQAEIAAAVQRLLQEAERQVDAINTELYKRPTSTGVRFRLQWQARS